MLCFRISHSSYTILLKQPTLRQIFYILKNFFKCFFSVNKISYSHFFGHFILNKVIRSILIFWIECNMYRLRIVLFSPFHQYWFILTQTFHSITTGKVWSIEFAVDSNGCIPCSKRMIPSNLSFKERFSEWFDSIILNTHTHIYKYMSACFREKNTQIFDIHMKYFSDPRNRFNRHLVYSFYHYTSVGYSK